MTKYMNLSLLRCLVVDDNAHMRKLTATTLYGLGIKEIHEAADGAAAAKTLEEFSVDIVVLDWVMSPEDGIAITRRIRSKSESPNPFLPIIMLTGHTEKIHIEQARDAGVTEFLSKPMSVKGLAMRIFSIIDKPRPFVRNSNFFGPNRRRHAGAFYRGPERRQMILEVTDG